MGGGLVEEHEGAVGEHDPGQREAGPLARPRARRRPRRAGCRARRGSCADAAPRARPVRSAAHSRSSSASGAAEPEVVGDRAGHEQPVAAGSQRDAGAPAPGRRRPVDAVRRASRPGSGGAARRARTAGWTCRSRTGPMTRGEPGARDDQRTRRRRAGAARSAYRGQPPRCRRPSHDRSPRRRVACDGSSVGRRGQQVRRPARRSRRPRRRRGTPRPPGAAASRPRGRAAGRPARSAGRGRRPPAGRPR